MAECMLVNAESGTQWKKGPVEDPGDGKCSTGQWGWPWCAEQTTLKVLYAPAYSPGMASSLLWSNVNKDKCVVYTQGYYQWKLGVFIWTTTMWHKQLYSHVSSPVRCLELNANFSNANMLTVTILVGWCSAGVFSINFYFDPFGKKTLQLKTKKKTVPCLRCVSILELVCPFRVALWLL